MEPERIKQKLETEFSPLRCDVEFFDFENRMRFSIFNKKNEPIITIPEVIIGMKFNDTSLDSIIRRTKKEIKKLYGLTEYVYKE